jgi:Flp pilus assembly pilin Flp
MTGGHPTCDRSRPDRARTDERALGQGVVEFGLILAVAALVAVVAIVFFGAQLAAILDLIGAQVERPA